MDRVDFFEQEELLQFLRVNKTAISLLENPQTLLNQLRDHNMIPEDQYKVWCNGDGTNGGHGARA